MKLRNVRIGKLCAAVVFAGSVFGAFSIHAQSPATGQAVRVKQCAACHGTPERAPLTGMPSLSGQQAEFLTLQLFLIRERLRDVPQMEGMLKGMTDAELTAMAGYFSKQKRLQPSGKPKPELQTRGAALAKTRGCGSCHLPDYSGQRQVPRLTGQPEDYLAATLKAYRDDKRSGSDTSMNAVMHGVSDSDIQALAHYLAHL